MNIRGLVAGNGYLLSISVGFSEEDMFWLRVDQALVLTGWDLERLRTSEFWDWFLKAWYDVDVEILDFMRQGGRINWEDYLQRHFNHHSNIFL